VRHATTAQPLVAAGQLVGGADEGDLLQAEGLALPGLQPALVEDLGNLAVTVIIQEAIDLGHELGLELAYLGDRQRSIEHQGAGGAA
jgi:hypothetical protein